MFCTCTFIVIFDRDQNNRDSFCESGIIKKASPTTARKGEDNARKNISYSLNIWEELQVGHRTHAMDRFLF